jgi:hypothetical protein
MSLRPATVRNIVKCSDGFRASGLGGHGADSFRDRWPKSRDLRISPPVQEFTRYSPRAPSGQASYHNIPPPIKRLANCPPLRLAMFIDDQARIGAVPVRLVGRLRGCVFLRGSSFSDVSVMRRG